MADIEDWHLSVPAEGTKVANKKCVRFSYTRDFLLSFSDMDICNRPPSGFEPSILSDCQEVTQSAPPEWRKVYGISTIQTSKCGDDGFSSATYVQNSRNSSHGVHDKSAWQGSGSSINERWENRPGSSDGSEDQQLEKRSVSQDSCRRYGSQSHQSWQSPERDGLLGTGDFPRPSVHAGGPLSPRVRGSGEHHLSHRTEPYHPPWRNKPGFQTRRYSTDLCNDETFGSSECSSQDKTEEEKRRRASFEMMRKEQQKALQEKLKHTSIRQSSDLSCLDTSEDENCLPSDNGVDGHVGLLQTDHVKTSLPQASASRPVVPPGFASTRLDKSSTTKPPIPSAETKPSIVKLNEEPWDPINQSSKFSCWFLEEAVEAKPSEEQHLHKAEGLLSLFVNNDKDVPPGQKNAGTTSAVEVGKVQEHLSHPFIAAVQSSPDASHSAKRVTGSGVLTCEDLEQLILAEANASHASVQSPMQGLLTADSGTTKEQTDIDGQASQHLLSLLRKAPGLSEPTAPSKVEDTTVVPKSLPISCEGVQLPEKSLTLETLFGTAFMQELQSVEAPVLVQRVSGGDIRIPGDLDLSGRTPLVSDINSASSAICEIGPVKNSHDISAMLYHGGDRKFDITKARPVFDDPKRRITSNVGAFQFEDQPADDAVDIHLPEEDSLISVGNPPATEVSKFPLSGITSNEGNLLSLSMQDDIVDKFVALSDTRKGNGSLIHHQPLQEVLRRPFDVMRPEVQYQQLLFGAQSLHRFSMNPSRPPYLQLEQDPNRNHEEFIGPNNGGLLRHPFAANFLQHPFHHRAGVLQRFEHPQHTTMQHMISGNFQGPHPLPPLPAGMPVQHQPGIGPSNHHMAAFMPELGSPFHQRPLNLNPMEMSIPGFGGRDGQPEGLRRLIEMELRANANKITRFVQNPEPLGPELDMGYGHRYE